MWPGVAVLLVATVALLLGAPPHDHDHESDHDPSHCASLLAKAVASPAAPPAELSITDTSFATAVDRQIEKRPTGFQSIPPSPRGPPSRII